MQIDIVAIDYQDNVHAKAFIDLMDAYASDPMGGGTGLSDYARQHLVATLAQFPTAFGALAFADGNAVGLINCFDGFSTFACRPLVNIHDVIVLTDYRNQGIGYRLLQYIEQVAITKGCCKLTLEVLQGNQAAQGLYRTFGFSAYQLSQEKGNACFWQKNLCVNNG
jgi:ribosomal protein S18 acetylase RimI-like enzyme